MKKNPLLKSLRVLPTPRDKRKYDIFEGFFVDEDLNSQIVLMSLSKGQSKSQFLREVVRGWMEGKDAVKEVVSYLKKIQQDYDFREGEFSERLRALLLERGASEKQIAKILKEITNE